jgi:ATP-dependent helicase/nuclease subunit A
MKILEKNLLILASAGSGKTFQLGNRVIGLVAMGVAPEKIVALTFTRKAAGEFADSVLTKLAAAAGSVETAAGLRRELALPNADFPEVLERVVRALPRLTLGTMDGFFAKVVRGFQYELGLTGGRFDLLEGPRAVAAADEILAEILGGALEEGGADEFLHAFRRASTGKEEQRVTDGLRGFVESWQGRYRTARGLEWGPADLAGVRLEDWEKHKHALAATVSRGLDGIDYSDKRQRAALEKIIANLIDHTIGSGSLGSPSSLMASIMEAAAGANGPLRVKLYKEFLIGGPAGDALRDLVRLAARCELAAALIRTRAVREVVSVYDEHCENRLRRRGMLGFDDVKILMGGWVAGEEARLRRDLVDFRLGARHDHWLLDEFQDTSRADWTGLVPLIDEAAGEGEGTLFIVGDRKQAIYGWRGGEVGLFDEVIARYRGGGLEIEPMAESWRSCPEVLALVNTVCGDRETLRSFFGGAADLWEWQDHFPADRLTAPDKRGEARVEMVAGKWEERLERLTALLGELGVGSRGMTCGVLVRSNRLVGEISDHLRAAGFDVIEEGRREPAKDHPVGIALWHLLKWLANPADSFSHEVVRMSPLAASLEARFGTAWQAAWEGLLDNASQFGFARMLDGVVADGREAWSDFGRRRAGDIIAALAVLDARGGATPGEAAEWIGRLEVSQSPGVAAVQVMTIHKSKGLGFDVVVLPDLPNDSVPQAQHFDVAQGEDWITETPPKWARDLIPEMRTAEATWAVGQRYEALCTLYVALTRSKRGLYVLLEPPSSSQDVDKPSLANWLATSVSSDGQPGVVYQSGSPNWLETLPTPGISEEPRPPARLIAGVPRRERMTASGTKAAAEISTQGDGGGRRFGTQVHAAFEAVGWTDETAPLLPETAAGALVAGLLEIPELGKLFKRGGRRVELLREQPVDAIVNGEWLSGVMDRLHLHRDEKGVVRRVEVIDFKTDAVADLSELTKRYAPQMHTYRTVMKLAYPTAVVECLLLSTRLRMAHTI